MRHMLMRAALAVGLALGSGLVPAAAQTPAEFFKGKTVRLVNGGAPGSGFDLYSRMLAPWLEKRLGANVIVESRPGAGMMIAMNHTWMAAPDGLTMMLAPGEGAILAKLVDEPGVRFDLAKFPAFISLGVTATLWLGGVFVSMIATRGDKNRPGK